jgi:CRP/FNR family cyclic AMP-dependent transcriptional regulator
VSSGDLIEALPVEARRQLLAEMRRRRFKRGEVVFHEGDPGDTLHVIDKGHVAIRATTTMGEVATFAVLGPGDAFGDQALLTLDTRRTASAVAIDATETRSLSREGFDRLRSTEPAVDRFLIEVLAAQVRRLSAHLVDALYASADVRIMRRLVELADTFATTDGTCVIPLTQDDVASLAGVARPTANRVLKAAEADGMLEVRRGRIDIVDRDELSRRADR